MPCQKRLRDTQTESEAEDIDDIVIDDSDGEAAADAAAEPGNKGTQVRASRHSAPACKLI